MQITIKIILDKRRMKKSTETFPVKLRIIESGKTRDFQTIYDLTEKEYESLGEKKVKNHLQVIREHLREIERDASHAAKQIVPFDLSDFEKDFIFENPHFRPRKLKVKPVEENSIEFNYSTYLKRFPLFDEDHSRPGCISRAYLAYIKKLLQEDRIGNALNYQASYTSIKKFKGNVLFTDITPGFLFQFEKWMIERGRTLGTVGIQLRSLRCIFNEVIAEGLIRKEKYYPFGRRKYQIPKSRNKKRAIGIEEIGSLYYYQPACIDDQKAKDFWMFCYYANGMNPKDVAYLKYKDVKDEFFTFFRAKTIRSTREDPKEIVVYITKEIRDIMDRWGNKDQDPDNYVFPILQDGMSAYDRHYTCRAFIKFINDRIAKMGRHLGLSRKITTIVSRHSFSTQLKRSGASTEFIQEALGHTDKATTENYLDSFEIEVKKEFASALTAFKAPETIKTAKIITMKKAII
ncbi:MAG: site-specific integrase [Bacteroidota bacterium]